MIILACLFMTTSCTVYTEKRSEALSQAVTATADSIDAARFDLADHYSKEAEKLAFPPKKRVKISSIVTKNESPEHYLKVNVEKDKDYVYPPLQRFGSIQTPKSYPVNPMLDSNNNDVLRLVIPEKFKDAKLLIEGSEEWSELLKTREFSKQLERDNKNLLSLQNRVTNELTKQSQMNSKMVKDLNIMQKKLVQKDLAILQRNIVIVALIVVILGATYLRIKGIL